VVVIPSCAYQVRVPPRINYIETTSVLIDNVQRVVRDHEVWDNDLGEEFCDIKRNKDM